MKTGREAGGGKWVFLEVNDGTSFQSLQAGHPYHSYPCWTRRTARMLAVQWIDASARMSGKERLENLLVCKADHVSAKPLRDCTAHLNPALEGCVCSVWKVKTLGLAHTLSQTGFSGVPCAGSGICGGG